LPLYLLYALREFYFLIKKYSLGSVVVPQLVYNCISDLNFLDGKRCIVQVSYQSYTALMKLIYLQHFTSVLH